MANRGGVRIEIFPERVKALLDGPAGMESRATRRGAEAVVKASKPFIGTKYSGYQRIRRERGESNHRQLAKSGKVEKGPGNTWRASFISDHALAHHEGHKDKIIYARNNPRKRGGGFMVFQAREGGQVFAKAVRGAKPNPYLIKGARKVGLTVTKSGSRLTQRSVLLGRMNRPTFKRFLTK